MAASKKTGRAPASPFKKALKELVRSHGELVELESVYNSIVKLKKPENPTKHDLAVMDVVNKRFELNKELDPILVRVHPLSRQKTFTPEEKKELSTLQNRRDQIHAELFEMAPLGKTKSEWEKSNHKREKVHGRPKLSLEIKLIRARVSFANAEEQLRIEEKNLSGKEKIEVEKMFGQSSNIPLSKIIEEKEQFSVGSSSGRPNGGEITKLERQLRIIRRKIENIESGEAQREIDQKMANRTESKRGNTFGRPFESLKSKLRKLKSKEKGILDEIGEIESKMSGPEALQRKIVVTRNAMKDQKALLESENLDEKLDFDHPEVIKYNRLSSTISILMSKRDSMQSEPQSVHQSEAKAQTNTVVTTPSVAVASEPVQDSKMSREEKLKEARLRLAKIQKAKKAAEQIKARRLKQQELKKAQENSKSNRVSASETEALKSIKTA